MKKILLSIYGAALVCAASFQAHANTILNDAGTGTVGIAGANANFGYDFTVGSTPLLVTALGLWDGPAFRVGVGAIGSIGDGFASEHVVGLWDNSGNLLAKAVMQIGTGDTLVGEFRYAATLIPTNPGPVILSANTTYVLGAAYLMFDQDPFKANDSATQATFDPAVSSGMARSSPGGFSFPSDSFGAGSLVGPNAMFTLVTNGNGHGVPESGTTAVLMLVALGGLLGLRRVVRA